MSVQTSDDTALAPAGSPSGDADADRSRQPHRNVGHMRRREFLLWSALQAVPAAAVAQDTAQTAPTASPPMPPTLQPALPGQALSLSSQGRPLHLYASGQGAPVLLVHSVNAAASAAEVRPLHLHLGASRAVFSLDLPGFGLSDRSDRAYTPRLMTDALHDATAFIRERCGAERIDALAVSLSCEFLARAATEKPQHYRSLALVSPTGFAGRDERRGAPEQAVAPPWVHGLVRGPGWGRLLYRGLTRPGVIRYFLEKTWGSADIDEEMWRYAVASTRQPGAEHAPLYFVSGQLFSQDIQDVYERLQMPVWMSHGERGDFTDYRKKTLVEGRPNWQVQVFPTGALPYFEVPAEFNAAWDAFLVGS